MLGPAKFNKFLDIQNILHKQVNKISIKNIMPIYKHQKFETSMSWKDWNSEKRTQTNLESECRN
jgi:hypothetical protein